MSDLSERTLKALNNLTRRRDLNTRTVKAVAQMLLRRCWREGEVDVTENVAPRFRSLWEARLVRLGGRTQVEVYQRSAIERLADLVEGGDS